MPSCKPTFCRICGEHESVVGRVSWRGKCEDCAADRMLANNVELREHTGESFTRWRRGMAASVGATLLDERPPRA